MKKLIKFLKIINKKNYIILYYIILYIIYYILYIILYIIFRALHGAPMGPRLKNRKPMGPHGAPLGKLQISLFKLNSQ
jgi:hypothetical protein